MEGSGEIAIHGEHYDDRRRARTSETINFIHFQHKILHKTIRFPCWSKDFVEKSVIPSGADEHEIRKYRQFNEKITRFRLLCVLFYAVFVGKNVIYLYYLLSSVNFTDYSSNIHKVANSNDQFDFFCLRSNCLKALANNQDKLERLIQLPIFTICNPTLRLFYRPVVEGSFFCIIDLVFFTFWVFVIEVLVPVHQHFVPTTFKPMMDLVCPQVALAMVRSTIKSRLRKTSQSFLEYVKHYCINSFIGNQPYEPNEFLERSLENPFVKHENKDLMMHLAQMIHRINDLNVRPNDEPGGGRCNKEAALNEPVRIAPSCLRFIDDCLPVDLTEEWRCRWTRAYVISEFFILSFGQLLFMFLVLVLSYLNMGQGSNRIFLKELETIDNCKIWMRSSSGDSRLESENVELLNFEESERFLAFLFILEFECEIFLPIFVQGTTLNNYYQMVAEFKVIVYELQVKTAIVYEYFHLLELTFLPKKGAITDKDSVIQISRRYHSDHNATLFKEGGFVMKSIQDKIFQSIRFKFAAVLSLGRLPRFHKSKPSSSYLEMRIAYQEFALNIMSHASIASPDDESFKKNLMNNFVDLYEKLLITHQTTIENFEASSRPCGNMLLFGHILTYGFSFICVYLQRQFHRYVQLMLGLTFIALSVANLLIAAMSAVHAMGQRLETQLWALLARSTLLDQHDCRLAHLRSIWLRQLKTHQYTGGIVIKAYSFNITYVGIIQLVLWTTTILLFSFGRD